MPRWLLKMKLQKTIAAPAASLLMWRTVWSLIIRANVKGVEVRRCRSCHNVRSAINRMTKNHGTLVKDFFKVTGDRLEAFYKEHGHLRGEDLRSKVEEVVTDWKTQTTRFEFNQDAEYLGKGMNTSLRLQRTSFAMGRGFFALSRRLLCMQTPSTQPKSRMQSNMALQRDARAKWL